MKRRNGFLVTAAALALLLLLPLIGTAASAGCEKTLTVTYGQTEARAMLSRINDLRLPGNAWYWNETDTAKVQPTNLSALTYDYGLEKVAMQRAAEIAVSFSHTRPDGTSCFTANPYQWNSVGENIAMGYRTEESVFIGWSEANDPYAGQGHRRNMLSGGFTSVGIGHAVVDGVHYWVQEFSRPSTGVSYVSPLNSAKNVAIPVGSHTLTKVTTGGATYYTCSVCGKRFTDPNGKNEVNDAVLSAENVTLYSATVEYNGKVRTPSVTVKNAAGVTLTKDKDYTVKVPEGRTVPGSYVYEITGKGSYSGTVKKTFTITRCTLKAENASLYSATVEYNGKERTPKVTVVSPWGVTLTEGTHYTVKAPDGRKTPGTYTYVITGKGRFTGTVNKTFTITRCTLKAENISLYSAKVEYNGKERTPKVTVVSPWGVTLTEGTHYTVKVPDGRKTPGTYTYEITGKGRFTGTVKKVFTITPCTLKTANVTLSASTVTYNGKVRSPIVTVKSPWGVTLIKGVHYTVQTPAGRKLPGKYTYVITGIGRFAGTVSKTFTITG